MNKIQEIENNIRNLNSFYKVNISQEIQQSAINSLCRIVDDDNLYRLVQPNDKGCWENAAIVLQRIGFPRSFIISDQLMAWLQDLNWPGAKIIFDTLLTLETTDLIPIIEKALLTADISDDTMWISFIFLLVDEKDIYNSLSEKSKRILDRRDI